MFVVSATTGATAANQHNATQVLMDVVDLAHGIDAAAARVRLHKLLPPVLRFLLGAIASGLGMAQFGFYYLACPLATLLIVLKSTYRRTQT